ncbi:MAG: PEP-CTERM sorting domain-containing protein [Halioglobus sp.]|nr:PEP-CTERM sorting domain-containing protein [Halioglobus sp.]
MNSAFKRLFSPLALLLVAGTVQAAPMDFDLQIDLTAPVATPLGTVSGVTGMFTADPTPVLAPGVVDCAISLAACEVSQLMLELSGGGGTLANVDLFMTDPNNPFGQFEGQAVGGFGTADVTGNTRFFYSVNGDDCGPVDTLCFGVGEFSLSLDLTGDGATADDEEVLSLSWASSPAAGAAATILLASIQGDPVCGAAAPCGELDVDPKPVPVPATLLLFGLGLAGLGMRRRG